MKTDPSSSAKLDDDIVRLSIEETEFLNRETRVILSEGVHHNSFSCSFWFYADNYEKTQVITNHGCESNCDFGWKIYIENNNIIFKIIEDEFNDIICKADVSEVGGWHHFVGVLDLDKSQLFVYLDGVLRDCLAFSIAKTSPFFSSSKKQGLKLGGYTDPAGGHFEHTFGRSGSGLLDDFRIYRRPLEPSEIFVPQKSKIPMAMPEIQITRRSEASETSVKLSVVEEGKNNRSPRCYIWDCGDGTKYFEKEIVHDYLYGGDYKITLTVIAHDYQMQRATQTLAIAGPEHPIKYASVFVNGEEGIAGYRIPSIVRAANGDLIAFAEGRVDSVSDSAKCQRIVCKRSKDNGRTWGDLQTIARNLVAGEEYACQEPSPVVDLVHGTGKIILVFIRNETNEWDLIDGKGLRRVCCIFSDDHGECWYGDSDITDQVHRPFAGADLSANAGLAKTEDDKDRWFKTIPARGHGIQLCQQYEAQKIRGRLLFAGNLSRGERDLFCSECYIFWSDDLGESWQIGGILEQARADGTSAKGLNEAMAVEIDGGGVLINARNYSGSQPVGMRAIARGTFDASGAIHFSPIQDDAALIEPPCQASITRFSFADPENPQSRSRILFSNPAHKHSRLNLTVRMSYDEGQTWPVAKVIDQGPSSYSDLVVADDHSVGVLYERGNQGGIWYAGFGLEWLSSGKDRQP